MSIKSNPAPKPWRDLTRAEMQAMFGESVSQARADYLNACARESIAAELITFGR